MQNPAMMSPAWRRGSASRTRRAPEAGILGYVIFERAAIRPLDGLGQGWQFGFNLNQGF
jgi:hypothetical protein